MTLPAQAIFGNYVARGIIGRGGMGEVRIGEHRFLGTRVAIKTLRSTHASNPSISQRFFREAKAAHEINHPNIVKVLDFGQTDDGTLYLVMEYLDGASLATALDAGPMAEDVAARVIIEIASAVAAAHDQGIIHRDLKPENVVITRNCVVKVLDFGIAKIVSAGITTDSTVLGTPLYVAPEQIKGAVNATPASDIYSLGAMLYELVIGLPPFTGTDAAQLLAAHLFGEIPSPRAARPDLSVELDALIVSCLAKERDDRPQSMKAIIERLRPIAKDAAIPAPKVPPLEDIDAFANTEAPRAESPVGVSSVSGSAGEMADTNKRAPSLSDVPRANNGLVLGLLGATLVGGVGLWLTLREPTRAPQQIRPVAIVAPPAAALPTNAAVAPPVEETLIIRSNPDEATVKINGEVAGKTPFVYRAKLPVEVELSLRGYRTVKDVLTEAGDFDVQLERVVSKAAGDKSPPVKAAAPTPAKPAKGPVEGLD